MRAHIHNIHDYMRNHGIGYGFDALDVFNFFYGLKLLRKNIKNKSLDETLSNEEKEILLFDNLYNFAKNKQENEVHKRIDKILDILYNNAKLKEIFYYEIKPEENTDEGEVFQYHM